MAVARADRDRGGWVPDVSQVVRAVGGRAATVASAVRRRLP
nr:hypothetical protein [Micromonospora provocatoris]